MFLKAFSANLRASIFICAPLRGPPTHISTIARSKLLQKSSHVPTIFYRQTSEYSTENAASNVSKPDKTGKSGKSVQSQKIPSETKLSQCEIDLLNQDPNNFGTLSSLNRPVEVNDVENASQSTDANDKCEIGQIRLFICQHQSFECFKSNR